MSTQSASIFLLLAFATVYSLEDGLPFANSAKGRKLKSVDDNVSPVYLPLLNEDRDPAAGTFKIIGEIAMGKPCCTSWGPGRVDCFIRAKISNVLHWWKENGKYAETWENLGGHIYGEPECVSRSAGINDILLVGTNFRMYTKTYNGGKWTGWGDLGQRLMERPSCVARTATNIDCVVRGSRNEQLNFDQVNGKWGGWVSNAGLLNSIPKAAVRKTDTTDYWHVGASSNLYQKQRVAGKWSDWTNHKGSLRGQPEVVSVGPNRYDILVPGTKNQLMHFAYNGAWLPWKDLGGIVVDAPSCVGVGGILHCFVVQSDSYLYRRYYDGKVWSDWFCAYGSFLDSPKCVVSNPAKKEVSCYLRGFRRELIEVVYNL